MNMIRKSFSTMALVAACAPFAASAADFTLHEDASVPTPFSRADQTQYPAPALGAPQFITQEQIATPPSGVAYERVNGRWVHVHTEGDHGVPKPDAVGGLFQRHDG